MTEQQEKDQEILKSLNDDSRNLFRSIVYSDKGVFINVQLRGAADRLVKLELAFYIGSYLFATVYGLRFYNLHQRKLK